jgi:predicted Zn-dependent peptidase
MGSPAAGIRENVANITKDHIDSYVASNIVGSNIVVAATGNVDHSAV